MLLSQFPLHFPSNFQWDSLFHHIAYDYSSADWDSLHDYLGDVPQGFLNSGNGWVGANSPHFGESEILLGKEFFTKW